MRRVIPAFNQRLLLAPTNRASFFPILRHHGFFPIQGSLPASFPFSHPAFRSKPSINVFRQFHTEKSYKCTQNLQPPSEPNENNFKEFKPEEDHHSLLNKMYERIKSLEKRTRFWGYSFLQIALGSIAAIVFGTVAFWEQIKEFLGIQGAQVATRSLEDEMVVVKVSDLSKAVVKDVLNDKATMEGAVIFVQNLVQQYLHQPETQALLVNIVKEVLQDPQTVGQVELLSKAVLHRLVTDPQTKGWVTELMVDMIQSPATKKASSDLVISLFQDPVVVSYTTLFFKGILASPEIQNQTTFLGQQVTQDLLVDEHLRELGKQYVIAVLTDPSVQQIAGDSLWRAFQHSLTPSIFQAKSKEQRSELVPNMEIKQTTPTKTVNSIQS